jgi:hypothetical protein
MSSFIFVLLLVGMVLAFIYKLATIGTGDAPGEPFGTPEEAQQLEKSLHRMEQRIEALETLLMEQSDRPKARAAERSADIHQL